MQKHAIRQKGVAVGAKAKGIILDSWQSQANLSFFLALQVLIAFVLPALGFAKEDYRLYSNIGFSVLLVSGVALAWGRWVLFAMGGLIGIAALIVRWLALGRPTTTMILSSDWLTLAAIMTMCVILLMQIFRTGRVTRVRIQGAIAVYLLLGVAWANAYHITEVLHPGSFSFPPGDPPVQGDWLYYSFVTLTTVGYGDIAPLLPIARTLAMAEALTGQLYLAVMIARLVAMEIVFWQQSATQNPES